MLVVLTMMAVQPSGLARDDGHPRAIRALDDAGVDVLDVEVRRPTLDDVFLTLTGHASVEDDAVSRRRTGGARR